MKKKSLPTSSPDLHRITLTRSARTALRGAGMSARTTGPLHHHDSGLSAARSTLYTEITGGQPGRPHRRDGAGKPAGLAAPERLGAARPEGFRSTGNQALYVHNRK
jgi:hypothetical protein